MRDVWLSEGFATFANWLWVENTGGATAQAAFNTEYARAANTTFWNNTVFDPGVTNQYQNATVYRRGGMTLQALRAKIGDEKFFQTLKDYVATFGGGTASTDDFIAIAQRDSGQDLRDFSRRSSPAWPRTTRPRRPPPSPPAPRTRR
jgi:aminopeptidase N